MKNDISARAGEMKTHPFFTRVFQDEAYAKRLEIDTRAALEEVTGPLPDRVEYRLVRDTATLKHVHIPQPPTTAEISDADLLFAQGGSTMLCTAIAVGSVATGVISASVTISYMVTTEV
ncbi:hypothetical protein [Ruegeria jejuensis]|uniref:hypothetical protein n=1 Tax=Ruegeria jejuensis TaxID=3233338 RepID=UPI00355B353D